jgi:hypothetical protein
MDMRWFGEKSTDALWLLVGIVTASGSPDLP